MPIYEYHCGDCKKDFEAIQKFSDAPVSLCPTCGGGQVKRLISKNSFQLKGTGWYVTDYKKGGSEGGGSSGSSKD